MERGISFIYRREDAGAIEHDTYGVLCIMFDAVLHHQLEMEKMEKEVSTPSEVEDS